MNKSIISSGEIIRNVLMGDATIKKTVTKIYPVFADVEQSKLPYIVYRRSGLSQDSVKHNLGAFTAVYQITVYTKDYKSGVTLAELVKDALDNAQSSHECGDFGVSFGSDFGSTTPAKLTMRSCVLTDSQEAFGGDAYIQNLIFTIKL